MRKILVGLLVFISFLFILPVIVVTYIGSAPPNVPVQVTSDSPTVKVLNTETKEVMEMSLDNYLVGVLAAEMPAKFEKEALKAQAIAARTYTLKRIKNFDRQINKDHPDAPLCTKPEHCQAWLSGQEMRAKWGLVGYWQYKRKIQAAVHETRGLVVMHLNQLIEPVYHSTCGQKTENSGDVWQYDLPYLKSVDCNWDTQSPKYQMTTAMPLAELFKRLGINSVPAAKTANLIKVKETTATGRIKEIEVGNTLFAATEFRRRLGLNSTNFTWEFKGNRVEFHTRGYGHGVGLCQYGANGLAQQGKTATEILKYYYTGVEIKTGY